MELTVSCLFKPFSLIIMIRKLMQKVKERKTEEYNSTRSPSLQMIQAIEGIEDYSEGKRLSWVGSWHSSSSLAIELVVGNGSQVWDTGHR